MEKGDRRRPFSNDEIIYDGLTPEGDVYPRDRVHLKKTQERLSDAIRCTTTTAAIIDTLRRGQKYRPQSGARGVI